MSEQPVAEMSYEDAFAELQRVVDQLEGGQVPLEDSIRLYERGNELKAHCEAKLRAAEEKVSKLTVDAGGNVAGAEPAEGL